VNDHSFRAEDVFGENTHITVYVKGELVYGTGPVVAPGELLTSRNEVPASVDRFCLAFSYGFAHGAAMAREIRRIGPGRVSRHAGDPN
jgi:hypothetical protein